MSKPLSRRERARLKAEALFPGLSSMPQSRAELVAQVVEHNLSQPRPPKVSDAVLGLGKSRASHLMGRSVDLSRDSLASGTHRGGVAGKPRTDIREKVLPALTPRQAASMAHSQDSSSHVFQRSKSKGIPVRFKPFDHRDADQPSDMLGDPGPVVTGKVTIKRGKDQRGKPRKLVLKPRFSNRDEPFDPAGRKLNRKGEFDLS